MSKKFYDIHIRKHGKNRFALVFYTGDTMDGRYTYNDMINLELGKAFLAGRGYAQRNTHTEG